MDLCLTEDYMIVASQCTVLDLQNLFSIFLTIEEDNQKTTRHKSLNNVPSMSEIHGEGTIDA